MSMENLTSSQYDSVLHMSVKDDVYKLALSGSDKGGKDVIRKASPEMIDFLQMAQFAAYPTWGAATLVSFLSFGVIPGFIAAATLLGPIFLSFKHNTLTQNEASTTGSKKLFERAALQRWLSGRYDVTVTDDEADMMVKKMKEEIRIFSFHDVRDLNYYAEIHPTGGFIISCYDTKANDQLRLDMRQRRKGNKIVTLSPVTRMFTKVDPYGELGQKKPTGFSVESKALLAGILMLENQLSRMSLTPEQEYVLERMNNDLTAVTSTWKRMQELNPRAVEPESVARILKVLEEEMTRLVNAEMDELTRGLNIQETYILERSRKDKGLLD
jgi:hypothetical protein